MGAGLLVTDAGGLRFRHEIARLAVADAVPQRRGTALHARLLDALTTRGVDDDARLAFHAVGAGDAEAILRHSTAAGRRAAGLTAHREAAAHYRRALAASDVQSADARTRAELLGALATELGLVDEWVEAETLWERALVLWRELGEALQEGHTLRMQSRALWRLARGEESEAAVSQALAVLEPLGLTPELARALKEAAGASMVRGQHRAALAAADAATELAERLDLPDVLSDVLDTRACSMMQLGQDWVPVMQQSVEVGLAAGCDEQVSRAYTNWLGGLIDAGRVAEADRLYAEAMRFCEDHDLASAGNCLLATHIESLELTGRWSEASRLGRSHLEVTTVSTNNRMHFMLALGRIGVRRGDLGIDAEVERAAEAAESTAEPQWIIPFQLLQAERHWIGGRPEEAAAAVSAALEAADSVADEGAVSGASQVWARRLGVDAEELGRVEVLAAAELRGDVAAAVAGWDVVGAPYQAALVLAFSPSTADQVEAVRRLEALGALPVSARVRRSLRENGVRSMPGVARASTREHPAGLTTREQEVLELLAEGLTNEEIAGRLVISVKTAGHHVSAVLAKLGVSGRRHAVAEAKRLDLLAAPGGGSTRAWARSPGSTLRDRECGLARTHGVGAAHGVDAGPPHAGSVASPARTGWVRRIT